MWMSTADAFSGGLPVGEAASERKSSSAKHKSLPIHSCVGDFEDRWMPLPAILVLGCRAPVQNGLKRTIRPAARFHSVE